ncbi:MAG: hypothetical protein P8P74_08195 [Crocinitomicaceae bacterium]|nr:hypothetical protein [Crocinitomicaceae bacterium]
MKERIYKVEKVQIKYAKTNPQKLVVVAQGLTNTAGWTDIELRPIPNDSDTQICDFEFVGTPPTGMVPQVLTEVSAMYIFDEIPPTLDGVRVYAATNSILVRSKDTNSNLENFEESEPFYEWERLKELSVENDVLIIRVPTGGCTNKDSFIVRASGFTGASPWLLSVVRVVPDYCEGYFPEGVELKYTFEEVGMEPNAWFILENQFQQ